LTNSLSVVQSRGPSTRTGVQRQATCRTWTGWQSTSTTKQPARRPSLN